MKKNILIVCPYPENTAPGQRLKYEQYLEYFLGARDIESAYPRSLSDPSTKYFIHPGITLGKS